MSEPIWTPDDNLINSSNMTDFLRLISYRENQFFNDYDELYHWSVDHPDKFWRYMFTYADIIHDGEIDPVVEELEKFPGA